MELKNERKPGKYLNLVDALKLFAPGTSLRTALDDILRARMGAIIVFGKDDLSGIIDGGFRINSKFSAQRLVELAKMDGAIVLSTDLKKIAYANTLLTPKILKTSETGTRHKAAERTAMQLNSIVVAVSERKNKITVYCGQEKYILEKSAELLRRATETLQILEKQKEVFEDSLLHLNILEVTNLATTNDVCSVLQRMEIIKRISDNVKRYLIELGREGIIVSMRLKELTRNLQTERERVLRDYFYLKLSKVKTILDSMNFDFLLETSNISRMLFEELHEREVSPKGVRILSKLNVSEKDRDALIAGFDNLEKIFDATEEDLVEALGRRQGIEKFKKDLDKLREKILDGKRV